MNDLERDLTSLFREKADSVDPMPTAPEGVLRRGRRRQVGIVLGGAGRRGRGAGGRAARRRIDRGASDAGPRGSSVTPLDDGRSSWQCPPCRRRRDERDVRRPRYDVAVTDDMEGSPSSARRRPPSAPSTRSINGRAPRWTCREARSSSSRRDRRRSRFVAVDGGGTVEGAGCRPSGTTPVARDALWVVPLPGQRDRHDSMSATSPRPRLSWPYAPHRAARGRPDGGLRRRRLVGPALGRGVSVRGRASFPRPSGVWRRHMHQGLASGSSQHRVRRRTEACGGGGHRTGRHDRSSARTRWVATLPCYDPHGSGAGAAPAICVVPLTVGSVYTLDLRDANGRMLGRMLKLTPTPGGLTVG